MIQNKTFKDRILLINDGVRGPKERNNLPMDPAGFHPMARNDWGMDDSLRAVWGRYYTVYESSKGTTLVNYSAIVSGLSDGSIDATTGGGHWDRGPGGIGRLKLQLNNIVLNAWSTWGPSYEIGHSQESLAQQYSPSFFVAPSRDNWNAYTNMAPGAHNWPFASLSNFQKYIFGDTVVMQPGAEVLGGLVGPPGNSGPGSLNYPYNPNSTEPWIQDRTCVIYVPSNSKAIREESGWIIDVKSQYNFYNARYENAVSRDVVKTVSLPNAYIMQSELQNTGSQLLADFHYSALTMGDAVDYFIVSPTADVSENTVHQAYDKWATALTTITPPPSPSSNDNSNFIILHSDEAITNEDYLDISTVPFCTKIIIPRDAHETTGINNGGSLLKTLAAIPATKEFVDILQVTAVNALTTAWPAPDPGPNWTGTRRTSNSVTNLTDYSLLTSYSSRILLCDVVPALQAYLDEFDAGSGGDTDTVALGAAKTCINAWQTAGANAAGGTGGTAAAVAADPPYRFLKDYTRINFKFLNSSMLRLDGNSPLNAFPLLAHQDQQIYSPNDILRPYMRTYRQILDGTPCHTETLMYVVKKYEVDENDEIDPLLPLQTFYISNKLAQENLGHTDGFGKHIVYYDSQVKYEKKYRYTFDKIVLVVGNKYYYKNANNADPGSNTWNTNWSARRRALQVVNKPTLQVIMVPHGQASVEAMVIDKPPVAPNMSFYAHKGVNDILQVLLNGSTGDHAVKPISILESDPDFFVKEYMGQTGVQLSWEQMQDQQKKIEFRSDDPVDAYQIFRLSTPPTSYSSFSNSGIYINPQYGTPGSYLDNIQPNVKYYYCARAIDVHRNISNPTIIMEIELVNNEGKIYLKQKPFIFETINRPLRKSGRRFILIEPSVSQIAYDPAPVDFASAAIDSPPNVTLGAPGLQDSLWNKVFKIRLLSKQTGRKIDLNITFKNPKIVKGS